MEAAGYKNYVSDPLLIDGDVVSMDLAIQPLSEDDLHLTKQVANTSVQPGDTVRFVLRLENVSGGHIASATVKDYLPANLDLQTGTISDGGVYDAANDTLTWNLTDLETESEKAVTLTYEAKLKPVPDGTTITNTATAKIDGHASYTSSSVTLHVAKRPTISVSKTADQATASVGGIVRYEVTVENKFSGPNPMVSADSQIVDFLPEGFKCLAGSTRIDGQPGPDPAVAAGRLTWNLGDIGLDQIVTLHYALAVGIGAAGSNGLNSAYVYGTSTSNHRYSVGPAQARVQVAKDVFGSAGMLAGTVFVDDNGNGRRDDGEAGVSDARLTLDNGRQVITDAQGRYSMETVHPGIRSVKLDRLSIDPSLAPALPHRGAEADEPKRAHSLFVTIPVTGIGIADFLLQPSTSSLYPAVAVEASMGDMVDGVIPVSVRWTNSSTTQDYKVVPDIQALSSSGPITMVFSNGNPDTLHLAPGASLTLHAWLELSKSAALPTTVAVVASPQEKISFESGQVHHRNLRPITTAVSKILLPPMGRRADAKTPATPAFVSPNATAIVPQLHVSVTVAGNIHDELRLTVNGRTVSRDNVGKFVHDPAQGTQTLTYYNVARSSGRNELVLEQLSKSHGSTASRITLYGPGEPARVTPIVPAVVADRNRGGIVPVTILVTDESGLPVRDGVPVTVSARGAEILSTDDIPTCGGVQRLTSAGLIDIDLQVNGPARNSEPTLRVRVGENVTDYPVSVQWTPMPYTLDRYPGFASAHPRESTGEGAGFMVLRSHVRFGVEANHPLRFARER